VADGQRCRAGKPGANASCVFLLRRTVKKADAWHQVSTETTVLRFPTVLLARSSSNSFPFTLREPGLLPAPEISVDVDRRARRLRGIR
jgi:hypothetical protein